MVEEIATNPLTPLDALSPRQRAFVECYVQGTIEERGQHEASARAAGYAPGTGASLLARPKVALAITYLREQLTATATARMQPWMTLAVKAQGLLEGYLDTLAGQRNEEPIRLGPVGLQAIRDVLDRALGRPTAKVERDIGERMDALIRELAARRSNQHHPSGGVAASDAPPPVPDNRLLPLTLVRTKEE